MDFPRSEWNIDFIISRFIQGDRVAQARRNAAASTVLDRQPLTYCYEYEIGTYIFCAYDTHTRVSI